MEPKIHLEEKSHKKTFYDRETVMAHIEQRKRDYKAWKENYEKITGTSLVPSTKPIIDDDLF